MKKIVLGAALSALSLGIPTVAHAQKAPASVIVVVDTDRVYRECTACVAAQGQLQALVTSSRTRAEQLGQPLQTEAQSIEQAGAALRNQTGSARTSGETALNARVQAFQQKQTAAQQELAQLRQLVTTPLAQSQPELVHQTFFALIGSYFQQLDFNQPVFQRYQAYLSQTGNRADGLQFAALRAISRRDPAGAAAAIDQLVSTFNSPELQLPVIRALAIYCLQQNQPERFERVVKRLALSHPDITETEKFYLLSLGKIGE